jgi:hypothetical protein
MQLISIANSSNYLVNCTKYMITFSVAVGDTSIRTILVKEM